jgi:hypothetical protein
MLDHSKRERDRERGDGWRETEECHALGGGGEGGERGGKEPASKKDARPLVVTRAYNASGMVRMDIACQEAG